jgi:hypothetical protein
MTTTKSFTATGLGIEHCARPGETISYSVSGTFVGIVVLQQYIKGGWAALVTAAAGASGSLIANAFNDRLARYRFLCSAYTSGTIVTAIADVTTVAFAERRAPGGAVLERSTKDGLEFVSARLTTPQGPVHAVAVDFTETTGAGTYTGAVPIPPGATLLDIIVDAIAAWTAATSAALDVGDAADPNGHYAAVNLKATDLVAGESLSFAQSGGKAGAYNAGSNTHWLNRYSATARVISGVVVTVGTSGNAGRTRMTVVYQLPPAADVLAATKV